MKFKFTQKEMLYYTILINIIMNHHKKNTYIIRY